MGKFLDRFKNKASNMGDKIEDYSDNHNKNPKINKKKFNINNKNKIESPYGEEDLNDDLDEDYDDNYTNFNNYDDEVGIQPSQKPESFHHFILENQYKDLERSIRGLKDVWNKEEQKWITKRKDKHCFTDEEAEDILRTAQSHLATDIKLGWIKKDSFGDYMNAVYKVIAHVFESIAEYRYGRYGDYEKQYDMKLQNHKIFLELWTRIQANYSRSIEGNENKQTHQSVKGQESLQSSDRDYNDRNRGYS